MPTILIDSPSPARASIEILPGGLEDWVIMNLPPNVEPVSTEFPFVLVENNLGIPKKTLYVLYTAAVHMPWPSSDMRVAKAASAIIILINPAHQTALNKRKLLIRHGYLSAANELQFIELISRGSPECGKQSMIWDHRRWCFQQIYGTMGVAREAPYLEHWASSEEMRTLPKMNPDSINHELNIVYHTCETYPRNYHAWSHWHFLINVCYAAIHLSEDPTTDREYFGVIVHEYIRLHEWIDCHVSDYSAVHQLCQTQNLIHHLELTRSSDTGTATRPSLTPLVDHALSLAAAYPNHEALWMYLRISLAGLPSDARTEFLGCIKKEHPYNVNHFAERLFAWYEGRERRFDL